MPWCKDRAEAKLGCFTTVLLQSYNAVVHRVGRKLLLRGAAAPASLCPRLVQGVIQRLPMWPNANNVLPFLWTSPSLPRKPAPASSMQRPLVRPALYAAVGMPLTRVLHHPQMHVTPPMSFVTHHVMDAPLSAVCAACAASFFISCCRAPSYASVFTAVGALQARD